MVSPSRFQSSRCLVILFWIFTALILKKKVFDPLLEKEMHLSRLEAISETTQMIAHDVRKPFHILRLSLQALKKATASDVRRLTDELTPTIEKISAEVDDMLRDIVDLEKPQGVRLAESSISDIVGALVEEYRRHREEQDSTIVVTLAHEHLAMIDKFKIQRVLSNLLQNAFQAVERNGKVWVSTIEQRGRKTGRVILVCVGNSGSVVAPYDMEMLFDCFFPKGKHNGTGLGLAIAKKFVNAHGGEIWCQSDAALGTRFYFSIPASATVESTSKIKNYSVSTIPDAKLGAVIDQRSGVAERRQAATVCSLGDEGVLHVALVGDDAFFRDGMKSLLESIGSADSQPICVNTYTMEEATRAELALKKSCVVIVDFENEFEAGPVAEMLRRLSCSSLICLYSRDHAKVVFGTFDAGCIHLAKPVGVKQVESVIKAAQIARKLSQTTA